MTIKLITRSNYRDVDRMESDTPYGVLRLYVHRDAVLVPSEFSSWGFWPFSMSAGGTNSVFIFEYEHPRLLLCIPLLQYLSEEISKWLQAYTQHDTIQSITTTEIYGDVWDVERVLDAVAETFVYIRGVYERPHFVINTKHPNANIAGFANRPDLIHNGLLALNLGRNATGMFEFDAESKAFTVETRLGGQRQVLRIPVDSVLSVTEGGAVLYNPPFKPMHWDAELVTEQPKPTTPKRPTFAVIDGGKK